MPFKTYYLSPEDKLECDLNQEGIRAAFDSKQGLLWVDITETTEDDGKFLEQIFHFHHLAVEDCVEAKIHSPKIDDFADYLFIVVHGVNHIVESDIVETTELAIFFGPNFVVSSHYFPLYSIEAVRHLVEDDGRPMRHGTDFLAYAIIDALIDNIMPTIDKMSDIADEIEEESIRSPQQSTLEAIMKLKRSTLRLHRVMAPQREVLNRLSRGEFPLIKDEAQIFYRDIYDHLVRIEDLSQTIRDRADNALATYLSSVANRQNDTMKVLSMVATIFLPLMLVAGIYGMNFENMPELKVPWAYFAVLAFIGLAIVVAIWWFWARNWITWGRRKVAKVGSFVVEPQRLVGYVGHLTKRSLPVRHGEGKSRYR
ncbi:MAG: magnesium/cobalt transporter CorA [Dehalococcoidia bacterium]|nr:magnesium/cobalt transporter CorA [Dehalococcoidia bacterium]